LLQECAKNVDQLKRQCLKAMAEFLKDWDDLVKLSEEIKAIWFARQRNAATTCATSGAHSQT
jgi:hypothetical protein